MHVCERDLRDWQHHDEGESVDSSAVAPREPGEGARPDVRAVLGLPTRILLAGVKYLGLEKNPAALNACSISQ